MPKEIIWQPLDIYQPGNDFKMLLDMDFALNASSIALEPRVQGMFCNMASDEVLKRKGCNCNGPYQFHKNTYFVGQFDLGNRGIWLALEGLYGELPKGDNVNPSHTHLIMQDPRRMPKRSWPWLISGSNI